MSACNFSDDALYKSIMNYFMQISKKISASRRSPSSNAKQISADLKSFWQFWKIWNSNFMFTSSISWIFIWKSRMLSKHMLTETSQNNLPQKSWISIKSLGCLRRRSKKINMVRLSPEKSWNKINIYLQELASIQSRTDRPSKIWGMTPFGSQNSKSYLLLSTENTTPPGGGLEKRYLRCLKRLVLDLTTADIRVSKLIRKRWIKIHH